MRVAVVEFQRSGDAALLPQRDHQHGVDLRRAVGFVVIFDNDFTVAESLLRGGA